MQDKASSNDHSQSLRAMKICDKHRPDEPNTESSRFPTCQHTLANIFKTALNKKMSVHQPIVFMRFLLWQGNWGMFHIYIVITCAVDASTNSSLSGISLILTPISCHCRKTLPCAKRTSIIFTNLGLLLSAACSSKASKAIVTLQTRSRSCQK